MKKKFMVYLSIALIAIMMMGCQSETEEPVEEVEYGAEEVEVVEMEARDVKVHYPDGIPALTIAKMVKEQPEMAEVVSVEYELQETPDLLAASIIKEEADIAIVPSNLAAQAFNKDLSYKILGTSTWGSMYLVTNADIETFDDLKDREIYSFAKGLTPDLVLRYVLANNDIDPDEDLEINYQNSAAEVGPAFLSGKSDLALLPEPLLSVVLAKDEDARILFDLNEEWMEAAGKGKGFPQSSLIIKAELLEDHMEFVEAFIEEYEASRTWAIENPEELGAYAEELGIGVERSIVEKGISWTNPKDFQIEDSREEYEIYYQAIMDFSPDFIGGKMPGEEIYFEK